MISKPAAVLGIAVVIALFIASRVVIDLDGITSFVFNVATFVVAFIAASAIWQASSFAKR